jgi:hypothetical protein
MGTCSLSGGVVDSDLENICTALFPFVSHKIAYHLMLKYICIPATVTKRSFLARSNLGQPGIAWLTVWCARARTLKSSYIFKAFFILK